MSESAFADEIGRKGEAHFDNIMADTDLLVGKIDPDRVGKDRVIEAKLAPRDETKSFDQRPAPLACSIQIKTVAHDTTAVKLSLSVAERFAQSLQPCFIYIIRVNDSRKVIEARAIHILGDNLAKVLKRLRKEFVAGTKDLHNKEITFQIKAAKKLGLEGEDLKAFLQAEIGSDMDAYCAQKGKQKKELGYEPGRPITIHGSFEGGKISELVDGLLGLRPLSMTNVAANEKRFGIPLPLPDFPKFQPGSLAYITPEPVSQCTLIIGSPGEENTVEVVCDVTLPVLPSYIPIKHFKALLKAPFIEATLSYDEVIVRMLPEWAAEKRKPVADWIAYYRTLMAFSQTTCPLSLKGAVGLEKLGVANTNDPPDDREPRILLKLLNALVQVREAAGVKDQPVDIQDVFDARTEIFRASDYLSGNFPSDFNFTVQNPPPEDMGDEHEFLFLTAFPVGQENYACGITCRVKIEPEGPDVRVRQSSPFSFADVAAIEDFEEALPRYRQRLHRMCKAELSLTNFPYEENLEHIAEVDQLASP
ncbi:hypothetical protein [Rhizobium sp. BR 249]|uniref:hypothetical protein n=1 Tax=Rhizobium sp. BR 249 TaxID=3040011 RepID=UPI0039BF9038